MTEEDEKRAFQTHQEAQRRRWLALTPAQRLEWLWQAKLFARRAMGKAASAKVPRAR